MAAVRVVHAWWHGFPTDVGRRQRSWVPCARPASSHRCVLSSEIFRAWVQQHLVKTLRKGDLVVMDNLSSHKGGRIGAMIQTAGATVLYLPPYSPDLNPIELAFAKLKQLLRSAGHRSINELWNDMQRMLDQISTADSNGFFRHCGYLLQQG